MAKLETRKRKPTHAIYHVRGEGKEAYWTRVGAAWLHDDGGGLSLALDFVPVTDAGRLVVRANKPTDGEQQPAQGEARP